MVDRGAGATRTGGANAGAMGGNTLSLSLLQFFEDVYAKKPTVAGGSPTSAPTIRNDVHNVAKYYRAAVADRPVMLSDMSAELIEGAMAWMLRRGRSPATANKLRRNLVALWHHAYRRGFLERPPLDVPTCKELRKDPEAWSIDEFNGLLEAASRRPGKVGGAVASTWWRALLLTCYGTGARIDVLMRTPADCFDADARTLVLKAELQKQKADQLQKLQRPTAEALAKLDAAGRGLATLFEDWPYDRRQRQWAALNNGLRRIIVDAGLRPSPNQVTRRDLWHRIRRTFGSYVAAKGGPHLAQSLLGHSSLSVTARYLDPRIVHTKSADEVLPEPNTTGLRLFNPEAG